MSDNFKALIVNQEGEKFSREIKTIEKSFLKHGDVLVKVDYSTLNFKDALILKNGARLVKEFPHIPGIDFSGTVVESKSEKFKEGDEIIQTGWRVGEIYFGGYSQFAKVNSNFLVKKPKGITSRQAMMLGTAGMTAIQCAFTTKQTREVLLLGEKVNDVIVTGASGGVGSIAVMILSKMGCNVTAATTKPNGIVAACGNASSIKLNTTVMPFIIRGVKLWGIDSVSVSIKRREFLWDEVSKLVDFDLLEKSIKEISLEQLLVEYSKMLEGKTSGRYIINVNK